MATPLLQTKLYIPPVRPEWISRPLLIEQLHAGLHRKLTLISAPAGFGKTTLLSGWIASTARPVAWVSLDEGDNDPARFWTYVVTALQTVRADIGQATLAMLRSPQQPAIEPLLVQLINEIAAIPECFVLVLDDYHTIQAPTIHEALTFLLDHLPPQLHLVVASRVDPPLPIALFRGRGQVTELRQADLRFTLTEAAAFLTQVTGLNLALDDVAALTARTEGWIAGLQMAAVSMHGRDTERISGFVAAFAGSHEYIADYLSDEVLRQQDEITRTFLLQTSILDHMTGPLCDAVTGQRGGQQRLEALQKANLFVVPLDDQRRWFRYHHLFASLLRQRLEQSQPKVVPELHQRASGWYEQNGLIADAVSHALCAGDVERVARVIEGNALAMMDHSDLRALIQQLDALPKPSIDAHPWLCIAQAWATAYAGQLEAAEPLLRSAERMIDALESIQADRVAARIAFLRSYMTMNRGDVCRATELAREALSHLPEQELGMRAYAMSQLGSALLAGGDLVGATYAHREAVSLSRASRDSHVSVMTLCRLAALQAMQGQIHNAAVSCRAALAEADVFLVRTGRQLPARGYALMRLSGLLYEWNELEEALHHVQEGIELSRQWGQADVLALGHSTLARILQATGDAVGAMREIGKARQIMSGWSNYGLASLQAWGARLQLLQGDIAAALRWAEESSLDADDDIHVGLRSPQIYCTLARLLIAQGEYAKSRHLLGCLLEVTTTAGAVSRIIEIRILQAIAHQSQGQTDRALVMLEYALSLAEPEGFVRTFIDEGEPMARLLKQAISHGTSTSYVHVLLAAMESGMGGPGSILNPREGLIEPLSEREIEVLRLLITHLSRAEIADRLFVSPNTIRFHVKNIYGKLGVHSRSDAVQRAEELNLL